MALVEETRASKIHVQPENLHHLRATPETVHWGYFHPNIKPALATLTIFAFMGSWNSFLWPLIVLRDPNLQTLPIALSGLQGQYTTAWDVVMAGSVISVLPMLAIYLFAQKYIIQGVASSGIK